MLQVGVVAHGDRVLGVKQTRLKLRVLQVLARLVPYRVVCGVMLRQIKRLIGAKYQEHKQYLGQRLVMHKIQIGKR